MLTRATLNPSPKKTTLERTAWMSQRRVCLGASPSLCPRDWRAWLGSGGWVGDVRLIKDRPCSSLHTHRHTHTAMKINRDDLWGIGEENFKGA